MSTSTFWRAAPTCNRRLFSSSCNTLKSRSCWTISGSPAFSSSYFCKACCRFFFNSSSSLAATARFWRLSAIWLWRGCRAARAFSSSRIRSAAGCPSSSRLRSWSCTCGSYPIWRSDSSISSSFALASSAKVLFCSVTASFCSSGSPYLLHSLTASCALRIFSVCWSTRRCRLRICCWAVSISASERETACCSSAADAASALFVRWRSPISVPCSFSVFSRRRRSSPCSGWPHNGQSAPEDASRRIIRSFSSFISILRRAFSAFRSACLT